MKEPQWLSKTFMLAVHDRLLAEHGGASGLRDEGLLESALARPQHLFSYDEPTLFDLAASYAYGLAKNHPFVDGNKRSAFVAAITFLEVNDRELTASEVDATQTMLDLASGSLSEAQYASWLKANCRKL